MNSLIPQDECTCPKMNCPQHRNCGPCREFHYSQFKLPYCERQDSKAREEMRQKRKDNKKEIKTQKKLFKNKVGIK